MNLNNSNARLDKNMFVPFGVVVGGGMGTFDKIYSGYGQLPDQDAIYARGYAYLSSSFPLLSYTTAGGAAPPPLSPLSLMLLQLTFSHRSLGRGRRCPLLPCLQQPIHFIACAVACPSCCRPIAPAPPRIVSWRQRCAQQAPPLPPTTPPPPLPSRT